MSNSKKSFSIVAVVIALTAFLSGCDDRQAEARRKQDNAAKARQELQRKFDETNKQIDNMPDVNVGLAK